MVNGLSLYFHLPFCTRKCDYCHFYVLPDKESFKKKLQEGLRKEWEQRKESITSPLHSLYFGGGTPSLYPPESIGEIISWIDPLPQEITLEVNPETISFERLKQYALLGINRISMGVQSFDPHLLSLLSRAHRAEQSKEAILAAKAAGIENISIDLMYDVPQQTLASWEKTLQEAISLPITHLSLYNLSIEPHTVFFKYKEKIKPQLPTPSLSLELLNLAIATLTHAGFERYEISAFAKNKKESIHNKGYWTGRPFLGFGPSACSYFQGSRFRNIPHLHRYCTLLGEGKEPIDFSETLSPQERTIEHLILRLRLFAPFVLEDFEKQFGLLSEEAHMSLIKLSSLGWIQYQNGTLSLTEQGALFHDSIAVELLPNN